MASAKRGSEMTQDAADVIENVLRSAVLPAIGVRIRPMSDDELAMDILNALDAAGYKVVPKERPHA
jgi:hypothetical protein